MARKQQAENFSLGKHFLELLLERHAVLRIPRVHLCVGHLDAVVAVVAAGRESASTSVERENRADEEGGEKKERHRRKTHTQKIRTCTKKTHKQTHRDAQNTDTETHKR